MESSGSLGGLEEVISGGVLSVSWVSGVMRASHSVMALGTSGTGETGGTNVYWELLMCFALGLTSETGGTNVC